jgi:hypothetical protein
MRSSNPGSAWWCAEAATLALFAYLTLTVIAFLASYSETKEFIAKTAGQYCWVYASISVYSAYCAVEALLVGASIYAARKLNSSGRSRIAFTLCVGVASSIAILRYLNGCG